jgi:hypothetical protein
MIAACPTWISTRSVPSGPVPQGTIPSSRVCIPPGAPSTAPQYIPTLSSAATPISIPTSLKKMPPPLRISSSGAVRRPNHNPVTLLPPPQPNISTPIISGVNGILERSKAESDVQILNQSSPLPNGNRRSSIRIATPCLPMPSFPRGRSLRTSILSSRCLAILAASLSLSPSPPAIQCPYRRPRRPPNCCCCSHMASPSLSPLPVVAVCRGRRSPLLS